MTIKNSAEWQEELDYIKGVVRNSAVWGYPNFNNDCSCFVRYVELQAGFALRDGETLIADEMLKIGTAHRPMPGKTAVMDGCRETGQGQAGPKK